MTEQVIIFLVSAIVLAVVGTLIFNFVKARLREFVVWENQVGVHYENGKFVETLDPGRYRFFGRHQEVRTFDTRLTQMVVQGQEMTTKDKATVKITVVAFCRVTDAVAYTTKAADALAAVYTSVQIALRELVGAANVDDLLERKAVFGTQLLEVARETAEPLGIEIEKVDMRDVILGGDLKQLYAGVVAARKEAQAKVETAHGEAAAIRTFANAARVFENNPQLMQLRYLDTLKEAGQGYGTTLMVGMPDFAGVMQQLNKDKNP